MLVVYSQLLIVEQVYVFNTFALLLLQRDILQQDFKLQQQTAAHNASTAT
jgi:hypothetical protein